jgi:ribosome-binding factor A
MNTKNHISKLVVENKQESSNRRLLQVGATLKKAVLEILNGHFPELCMDFSVIEADVSPDLRYLDIFLEFYFLESQNEKDQRLKELNYDDLDQKDRAKSRFARVMLKQVILEQILRRMRIKYVPKVRFRMATKEMLFLAENGFSAN